MTRLILASASPRRQQLLAELGVVFEVRATDVDETPAPGEGAEDLVRRLAVAKAEAGLAAASPTDVDDLVVLAADTLVAVAGEVLGKPVDEADAVRMLRLLSGSRHQVHTGVAVAARRDRTSASLAVEVATTHVHMRSWSDDEIASYVASGEPMDKAGSYAIQEGADRFVERIEGRFDTVVGLPLDITARLLADAGIEGLQPPEV